MFKLKGLAAMMLVLLMFFASTSTTNAAEVVQSEKFQTNINEEVNLSLTGDDYLDDSISPFGFYLYKDVDVYAPQSYKTNADVPATYYYESFSGSYWYTGRINLYKTEKLTNGTWRGYYRGTVSAWVE